MQCGGACRTWGAARHVRFSCRNSVDSDFSAWPTHGKCGPCDWRAGDDASGLLSRLCLFSGWRGVPNAQSVAAAHLLYRDRSRCRREPGPSRRPAADGIPGPLGAGVGLLSWAWPRTCFPDPGTGDPARCRLARCRVTRSMIGLWQSRRSARRSAAVAHLGRAAVQVPKCAKHLPRLALDEPKFVRSQRGK